MRSRQGYKGKALLANEFVRVATLEDEQGRGESTEESGDNDEPVRRSLAVVMSQARARRAASRRRHRHGARAEEM